MIGQTIRHPEQIRQSCVNKLPRAMGEDDTLIAVLGCLLDQNWSTPQIVELRMTSNRYLLGRAEGGPKFKHFFGAKSDVVRSILEIAEVAELDDDELGYILAGIEGIAKELPMRLQKWEGTIEKMVDECCCTQGRVAKVLMVWRAKLEKGPALLQPHQIDEIIRAVRERLDNFSTR